MARSFARIVTAIWRNKEFRALPEAAQRTYLLLVTQPNISAAGTLPLTARRWAEAASDTTVADINRTLAQLVSGRFIGVDYTTEEVLVRSFVRWDGGYGNSKRRPVIIAAAGELVSPELRRMLGAEFGRLGLPFAGDSQEAVTESSHDSHSETYNPVDRLSVGVSDSPPDTPTQFDRVVGCQGEYSGTTTLIPKPVPPSAAPPVDSAKEANKAAQRLARIYTDRVKLSNFPAVMMVVKKARGAGYADAVIEAALERLATDGRSVTTDSLRYELDGFPGSRPTPNATDQRIAELLRPAGLPNLRALPGGAS